MPDSTSKVPARLPARRSHRLKHHDYASAGAYYVTICTQDRLPLLGTIRGDVVDLSPAGTMIAAAWQEMPQRFLHVQIDEFVVLPDHFHGIVWLLGDGARPPRGSGEHEVRPYGDRAELHVSNGRPSGTAPGSLGRIIQAFKSITTWKYTEGVKAASWQPFRRRLWQRDYYDHIIRNDQDLYDIRQYIRFNVLKHVPRP